MTHVERNPATFYFLTSLLTYPHNITNLQRSDLSMTFSNHIVAMLFIAQPYLKKKKKKKLHIK